MMGDNSIIKKHVTVIILIISTVTISCSKKITFQDINEPFYREVDEISRKVHKEHNNTISFNEIYDGVKYEIDRSSEFRNQVIDSLGLLYRNNWLLIELGSTNYSGTYQKSFIFIKDNCFTYTLPDHEFSGHFFNSQLKKISIESMENELYDDVFKMYKAFQEDKINLVLASKPTTNPVLNYKIIQMKKGKLNSFIVSSKDYLVKKW
jgi:hypothetical protein